MAEQAARTFDAQASGGHLLRESSAERLFVAGGIILILAGMLFGDVFAVFILHPNADRMGDQLLAASNAVTAHDVNHALASFSALGKMLENRGTKVDAHAHIIDFGYIAFVLALLQPWVGFRAARKRALAVWFLMGATLLPIGVFLIYYFGLAYSPWQFIGWASVAADLGGLIVIVVCVAELCGIYLFFSQSSLQQISSPLSRGTGKAGRLLLAGGTLLMVVGFLFGAYYAAFDLYRHEAQETSILARLVDSSASGDSSAPAIVNEYGFLQAEKAINIAAHAHFVEFGVLAFLLALIQPIVFLSEVWKVRWATVLLAGSFILPSFVALELKLGLLAGGIADFGGGLVILALCAMLGGIVRSTGRMDASRRAL